MSYTTEAINSFFNFDVFDENVDKLYCCNSMVIYKNKLYKSLKNENDRHVHDEDAWFYIGTLADIINYILADDANYQLEIPYYPDMCSGNNCTTTFDKGQCVVDRIAKLDNNGNPVVDDCGKTEYTYLIFTSLIDCNTTPPLIGSQTNPLKWSKGMTPCEYLNRSVGYTQNGDTEENIISALNRKCLLGCDAPDDETIALATKGAEGTHSQTIGNKLRVRHDNESIVTSPTKGLEVAVIGKDKAGKLVDVRQDPCFVTCKTMGNGLTWDDTAKKWIVNLATASGQIEALLDTLAGLKFNANKIAVAIKNGLMFNTSGEIEVKPANNSITVDANGVKVGEIGKDPAGNPINVNDCLITCDDLGNGLILAGNKVVVKAADDSIIVDENGIRAKLIPDSDVTIADTNESRGSPIKVDQQGLNAEGDPHYVADYDTANTPRTTAATPKPWRLVIEAADGKEYVLRSGKGYREHHDGRAEMWGTVLLPVGSEDKAVEVTLPVPLDDAITYSNSHVSVTDVGWAAAEGQDLDDLPTYGISDPSVDAFNNTDVGWAPSATDPVGKFIIWPYQHESNGSNAIELVSWHLVTERGLA